jgi:site-specific DNA recombinase
MADRYEEKYTYFLYARKSEENEDRQVQSIEDQINRLNQLAQNLNIKIKEIFTEAKSAKKPDHRPAFSEMLKRLEKGEADGILCWQINRLSRNPVDSGTIQWMLQQGVIKSIQTIDRRYLPDDNAILLSVESSVANQFIIDLRKNCRRGMEGKAERGWFPALAPIGYMNDGGRETSTIIPDKVRFKLVRKMWDLMLTGNYTPNQIRKIATDKWGFRTPKRKRIGDKELSLSLTYKLFSSIFYTGMFEWSNKVYAGKHKPLITIEEFDRVQELLGRKGKPRSKTHEFAYTGLIECADCGSMYTATEKTKFVKSTGKYQTYIYYHCTKKKKNTNCTNAKPVTLTDVEKQITSQLAKYTIRPEFLEWGLHSLEKEKGIDTENEKRIYDMRQASLQKAEKEFENLTRMRYKEMIDEDMYMKERNLLQLTIGKLKQQLSETKNDSEKYIERTAQALEFVAYAEHRLINGTIPDKREVLNTFGSNCTIKDKKLFIKASEWLKPIEKKYPSLLVEFEKLELNKTLTAQRRNSSLLSIRQRWCAIVKDVGTIFQKVGEVQTPPVSDVNSLPP